MSDDIILMRLTVLGDIVKLCFNRIFILVFG